MSIHVKAAQLDPLCPRALEPGQEPEGELQM